MATKKDLVEAHAFSRRRLVTAFVSGAPGGREVEPVRPGRVLIGGMALSVLLLAGAAIAGFLLGRCAVAKSGDTVALRLCLERIAPARKDRPVLFELPVIETTADLPRATGALLQAVASGDLTPSEAAEIGKAVDAHVRAIEAADLQVRLSRLEQLAQQPAAPCPRG